MYEFGSFLIKKLKMNTKLKELEEKLEDAYIKEIWSYLKKCKNERYYIGYDVFALDDKDVPAVKIENGELYFFVDIFHDDLTGADLFFENDELDKDDCAWYNLNGCIDYIDEFGIDRLIFLKAVYNAMDIANIDNKEDNKKEENHLTTFDDIIL